MTRNEVKQLLQEQILSFDEAVKQKMAYLQSDDVFAIDENIYDTNNKEQDNSLENAFNSQMVQPLKYNQPKSENDKTNNFVPQSINHSYTVEEYRKNIAAKIAALRGLSLPGDYMRKK